MGEWRVQTSSDQYAKLVWKNKGYFVVFLSFVSVKHIYLELNQDVNPLWKCALKEEKGLLLWEEFLSQR